MDITFDLLETGTHGHLEIIQPFNYNHGKGNFPYITIPVDIPPVVKSLRDQVERYIDDPSLLPMHDDKSCYQRIPRWLKHGRLLYLDTSPLETTIFGRRDAATGKILELVEEELPSTSRQEKLSSTCHQEKLSSTYHPEKLLSKSHVSNHTGIFKTPDHLTIPGTDYLSTPPGFGKCLTFDNDELELEAEMLIDISDLSKILRDLNHFATQQPIYPPSRQGTKHEGKPLSPEVIKSLGEKEMDLLLQIEQDKALIEPEHSINHQPVNELLNSKQMANGHLNKKRVSVELLTGKQVGSEHLTSKQVTNEHLNNKQVINKHLTSQQLSNKKLNNEQQNKNPTPKQTERQPSRPDQWAVFVDVNESVQDFHEIIPQMAFKWPFKLDTFQKQAILRLENNECVFVAAHTSAGKTVVAEYAIALSIRHTTRTIYTTPVKALSNQKYRELKMTFDDIGLMTGDIQIGDTASCIVMTTEILRTMLYEGSEIFQELEWVIIDEVHYIDNADRGVVWEEVLIMLPDHVKIVMLSATVTNTMELAEWVGRIKRKQVHVITTKQRPVPLQHFLYTGAVIKGVPNGLFKFIDEKGRFLEQGYYMAMDSLPRRNYGDPVAQERQFWKSVIHMIIKNKSIPAVVFYFSKKKINDISQYMTEFSLTSHVERDEISSFMNNCLTRLEPRDHNLPQVRMITGLLQRGFGVHHSGILTVFREMVEILFQKGLIKVLLATETFAMGVNMPANTVLFESVMKFDGKALRPVFPSEYAQMSGRAGRRGHDTMGTVIVLCNGELPNLENLHKIALGIPTPLESRFRLTYSMILHLMRVERVKVHDMMKSSFSEFHTKKESLKTLQLVKSQVKGLKEINCYMCSGDLRQYHAECLEFYRLHEQLQARFLHLPRVTKSMTPRRVLMVRKPNNKIALGVLLATYVTERYETKFKTFILTDYLMQQRAYSNRGIHPVERCTMYVALKPWYEVVELSCKDIFGITGLMIDSLKTDKILRSLEQIQITQNQSYLPDDVYKLILKLQELSLTYCHGMSAYHTFSEQEKQSEDLADQWRAISFLWGKLFTHNYSCKWCPKFLEHFYEYDHNVELRAKHTDCQKRASEEYLTLLPEYHQRVQVLRKLKYISDCDLILIKAKVACCFIKHEVVITEVIMENVLTELEPEEIAALLSCFVLQKDTNRQPSLNGALDKGKQRILQIAEQVGTLQVEMGMRIPVDFFKSELHFGLTQVVYEWAKRKAFSCLMTKTDVDEGVITNCIQSLHDMLARVKAAGELIGNDTLAEKCQAAMTSIKRDIVFAASLYLQ